MLSSVTKKVKAWLGIGAITISVVPGICDGKLCTPIKAPDLPCEGSFSSYFPFNHNFHVIAATGVTSSVVTGIYLPKDRSDKL